MNRFLDARAREHAPPTPHGTGAGLHLFSCLPVSGVTFGGRTSHVEEIVIKFFTKLVFSSSFNLCASHLAERQIERGKEEQGVLPTPSTPLWSVQDARACSRHEPVSIASISSPAARLHPPPPAVSVPISYVLGSVCREIFFHCSLVLGA